MILRPLFIVLSFSFLLYNCNIVNKNNSFDKKEAEAVTNKFYHFLEMNEFDKAEKLFIRDSTSNQSEVLQNMFKGVIYEYGNLKNFELDHWESVVVNLHETVGQFKMQYYVTREYKHTFENITLVKKDDSIEIFSYEIKRDSY